MKRFAIMMSLLAVFTFATNSSAAVDKTAISTNVDTIVAMIDAGKDVNGIQSKDYEPYAFIMEDGGKMLVHPSLTGVNYQEKEELAPIYNALKTANADGVWVQYEWLGKMKNAYVKKTQNNLIVGSGY